MRADGEASWRGTCPTAMVYRLHACGKCSVREASMLKTGCWRSTWVMLNTVTRRLAKMPDEMRLKMEYMAPHPHRC